MKPLENDLDRSTRVPHDPNHPDYHPERDPGFFGGLERFHRSHPIIEGIISLGILMPLFFAAIGAALFAFGFVGLFIAAKIWNIFA